MANITLLGVLIFYLVMASGISAVIISGYEGSDNNIALSIDTTKFKQSSVLNMTDNNSVSQFIKPNAIYDESWKYTENGLEKVSNYGTPFIIPYVQKQSNNEYVNNYYIKNPNSLPYYIWAKRIGAYGSILSEVKIAFDESGIHYINNIPYMPDNVYYPVSVLNDETAKITTILQDTTEPKYLKVYYNDNLVIESYSIPGDMPYQITYYSAVDGFIGFAVSLIIGSYATGNDVSSFVDTSGDFLTTLFLIITWNVDESYMPLLFNMMLIKVPLFMIVGIIVTIIRGN